MVEGEGLVTSCLPLSLSLASLSRLSLSRPSLSPKPKPQTHDKVDVEGHLQAEAERRSEEESNIFQGGDGAGSGAPFGEGSWNVLGDNPRFLSKDTLLDPMAVHKQKVLSLSLPPSLSPSLPPSLSLSLSLTPSLSFALSLSLSYTQSLSQKVRMFKRDGTVRDRFRRDKCEADIRRENRSPSLPSPKLQNLNPNPQPLNP